MLQTKKGVIYTDKIIDNLLEELNCKIVFKIGGIGIAESVVVTWIIMAVLVLLSIIFVRNLKVENVGKKQILLESGISWANDFFENLLGKKGKRYIPYLITVLLYIAIANLIGLLGFKPPTKDLNVTAGLAIMSALIIEGAGIKEKGFKGYLKAFTEPMALITPISILEVAIRPLSLCMRLFGNVLGSFVIMELIKALVPILVPLPFNFYFDIFDGLIQAYVFVFLSALNISEKIE